MLIIINIYLKLVKKTAWTDRQDHAFFSGYKYPVSKRGELQRLAKQYKKEAYFNICITEHENPDCWIPIEEYGHTFKMFIHCAGLFYWSSHLPTLLSLGGTVIRQTTPCNEFWDSFFLPNQHYLPVNYELTDLVDTIQWCKLNQEKCQKIGQEGTALATKVFSKHNILEYGIALLNAISKRQNISAIVLKSGAKTLNLLDKYFPFQEEPHSNRLFKESLKTILS